MTTRLLLIAALGLGLLGPARAADPPRISLELRDAPLRQALEQLFDSAGLQYQIDNEVRGFTTLKIREQPLESALKLLLRSGTQPLTYKIENGVYQVSVRRVSVTPPEPPAPTQPEGTLAKWEFISLTYVDPMALTPFIGPVLEWRRKHGKSRERTGKPTGQRYDLQRPRRHRLRRDASTRRASELKSSEGRRGEANVLQASDNSLRADECLIVLHLDGLRCHIDLNGRNALDATEGFLDGRRTAAALDVGSQESRGCHGLILPRA
jgi:hypothetical protein